MRAWGAAVSSGHIVLGALGWLLIGVPPVFFAGCAVVTLAVALLAAPLLRPRDDDHGEDGGRGGQEPGDGGGPPWWPQFEREFRAYADERRRAGPLTPR